MITLVASTRFLARLDMEQLQFVRAKPAETGRRGYTGFLCDQAVSGFSDIQGL
jgi:hypothetical protein